MCWTSSNGTVVLRRALLRAPPGRRRHQARPARRSNRDGSLEPMEPTSSPDNARPARGLARFWPVHRDTDGEGATLHSSDLSAALSGETEMVALGSRRPLESLGVDFPPPAPPGPVTLDN